MTIALIILIEGPEHVNTWKVNCAASYHNTSPHDDPKHVQLVLGRSSKADLDMLNLADHSTACQ